MELRFAKWEVGVAQTVEKIEQERTNEARCRTVNKERTRVSPRQMLALWQKELDKDKGKAKYSDWESRQYSWRGQKRQSLDACIYADPMPAEKHVLLQMIPVTSS